MIGSGCFGSEIAAALTVDGQIIAFTRGPSSGLIGAPGSHNLMVTNVEGSNLHALTEGNAANYAMSWSRMHFAFYTL